MDEEIIDGGAVKRGGAKQGRRKQGNGKEASATNDVPSPPPRVGRRTGGWGSEAPVVADKKLTLTDSVEDERLKPTSGITPRIEDSDDEGPAIPTLMEETEKSAPAAETASFAPKVSVARVATYHELDSDLTKHAAFLTLDNEIDLKLLGQYLSSEAEVFEEDREWSWDQLFADIYSDLTPELQATLAAAANAQSAALS